MMQIKNLQPTFTFKLVLIVVAALVGVLILATVAWKGLENVQHSSQFVFKVGHSKDQIRQLQLQMMRLQNQSTQQVQTVEQEASVKLQQLSAMIDDQKVRSYIGQIQTQLKNYSQQLQITHQVAQQLGSEDSGLIKQLNSSGNQLEEALSGKRTALRQLTKMRQIEKEFLLSPDTDQLSKLDSQYKQLIRAAKRSRTYINNKALFQAFEQQLSSMKTLALSHHAHATKLNQLQNQFATLVADTLKYMENELQVVAQKNSAKTTKQAELGILIGTPILAVTLIILLTWIGLGVRQNLNQVVTLMKSIANGDLSSRLTPNRDRNDEFDQLADMANQMANHLQDIIQQVVSTSHRLTQMAEQLGQSIHTIAQANTEVSEQSATLASSTEEISVTTGEVAQTSENISSLTKDVHSIANDNEKMISDAVQALQNATQVVDEANNSMGELAQKSQSIDQVVELINGITEQTNLLALNAAIEAARAGEAGRGFAVVADEVRGLATHTVKATSEIGTIVESIQQQVEEMTKTMHQGAQGVSHASSLGEEVHRETQTIETRSNEVSDAVQQLVVAISQIASTSRDMANRMETIAKNVDNNRQATQQILGVVSEIKSDTHELDNLTRKFSY